ncbi:MAG: pantoate--beta-alanine ligase [Candidatus Omnitrophota bacterium]
MTIVVKTIKEVREIVEANRNKGKSVGFIPTMGSLHSGHLSLLRAAKRQTSFVVVSIFVNPYQFGPKEDYKMYPRDFKKDESLLLSEGVDLIFHPKREALYSKDFSLYVEEVSLSKNLCGRSRLGHFKGVCTVVAKLFNIVTPDIAYFGRKDYQQAEIIKRMVRDLNYPIKIRLLPIVREKNRLAISSRNKYLNEREKQDALCLYHALKAARLRIKSGQSDSKRLISYIYKFIKKEVPTAVIDYISVVDPYTLEDVNRIEKRVLIAFAVYIGKTRLIDNMVVSKG